MQKTIRLQRYIPNGRINTAAAVIPAGPMSCSRKFSVQTVEEKENSPLASVAYRIEGVPDIYNSRVPPAAMSANSICILSRAFPLRTALRI